LRLHNIHRPQHIQTSNLIMLDGRMENTSPNETQFALASCSKSELPHAHIPCIKKSDRRNNSVSLTANIPKLAIARRRRIVMRFASKHGVGLCMFIFAQTDSIAVFTRHTRTQMAPTHTLALKRAISHTCAFFYFTGCCVFAVIIAVCANWGRHQAFALIFPPTPLP
jgi:hypothetical protein